MPFDGTTYRGPDADPWSGRCRSCKQLIGPDQPVERLAFAHDPMHRSHEVNGTYHSSCARPYISLVQALSATKALLR